MMGWFEKHGRQSDMPPGRTTENPVPVSFDAPTQPIPTTAPIGSAPTEERYDPTLPTQAAVAGIDLPTFAAVSRQLLDTPTDHHANLLASYGHTPTSWNAVNTAWIARLGRMPFLYAVYNAAYRSS
jgi:hypothetical protein